MNEYLFEDLKIGMKASFEAAVTREMMDRFADLSGDVNPLHTDGGFAREAGFDDKVVYGLLTSAFLSRLVGIYLPGKYCLLRSVECKYIKPAYMNDKLTVNGEIIEVNDTGQLAVIKADVMNSQGNKILKAKIKIGFTKTK